MQNGRLSYCSELSGAFRNTDFTENFFLPPNGRFCQRASADLSLARHSCKNATAYKRDVTAVEVLDWRRNTATNLPVNKKHAPISPKQHTQCAPPECYLQREFLERVKLERAGPPCSSCEPPSPFGSWGLRTPRPTATKKNNYNKIMDFLHNHRLLQCGNIFQRRSKEQVKIADARPKVTH